MPEEQRPTTQRATDRPPEPRAGDAPPPFEPARGAPPMLPDYEVVHQGVGVFLQGDIIPPGTYTEEQTARLVGLGAIRPVAPPLLSAQQAEVAVESAPESAEEFKAREDEAATAAAVSAGAGPTTVGGQDVLDDIELNAEQRQALRDRQLNTRESIDLASDEHLLGVPGIGHSSMQKLRDGVKR